MIETKPTGTGTGGVIEKYYKRRLYGNIRGGFRKVKGSK